MDISIRRAQSSDVTTLHELVVAFAETNPSNSSNADEDLNQIQKAVDTLLSSNGVTTLVAENAGKVLGAIVFASLPSLVHGGRNQIFIDVLVVHKEFRRKGVGRSLVNRAIQSAKELGAYKVALIFRHDNDPARWLYESCGFEPTGIACAKYL